MCRLPDHRRILFYLSVSTTCLVTVGLIHSSPALAEPPGIPAGGTIIRNMPPGIVTGSITGTDRRRTSHDPLLAGGNFLTPDILHGAIGSGAGGGTTPSGPGRSGVDPRLTTLPPGLIPPISPPPRSPLDPGVILPPGLIPPPLHPSPPPLPGGSPLPGGGTPSPGGGMPPGGGTPPPGGGTPPPGGGTPPPGGGTPPGRRTPGGRTPTPTDPGARTPPPGTSPILPPGGSWPVPVAPPTITFFPPTPPIYVPVPVPVPTAIAPEQPFERTGSVLPIDSEQPHTLAAVIGKLHCANPTAGASLEGGADQLCVAVGTLAVYDDGSTRIFGDCFGYVWDGSEFNVAAGFSGGPYTQHPIFCVNEVHPNASPIETAAAGKRLSYLRVAVVMFEYDPAENPPVTPDPTTVAFDGLLGRRSAMTSELGTYSLLDFGSGRRRSMASNEVYWGRDISDVGQVVNRTGAERMTNSGRENDLIGISEWVFTPADLRELSTYALQFRGTVPTATDLAAQHVAHPDYRGIRSFFGHGDQSNYDGEIWFTVVPQSAPTLWTRATGTPISDARAVR